MRGLTLHGNQWNIIGGRCYITKEGMRIIVGNLPGLTDLNLSPSIPQFTGIGAVLDFRATWKIEGKPQELTRKIVVKAGPGEVDLAIGKATRKMLAAVYEKVTGSSISDGEIEEPIPPRQIQTQQVQRGPASIIADLRLAERQGDEIAFNAGMADARDNWKNLTAAQVKEVQSIKEDWDAKNQGGEQRPDPTPTPAQSAAGPSPATATSTRVSKPTKDARDQLYFKLQRITAAYGCDMDALLFEVREQWGTDLLADLTDADVEDAIRWADGKLAAKAGANA
jgi:hypothetical protein